VAQQPELLAGWCWAWDSWRRLIVEWDGNCWQQLALCPAKASLQGTVPTLKAVSWAMPVLRPPLASWH
jgi:hypothetical protein